MEFVIILIVGVIIYFIFINLHKRKQFELKRQSDLLAYYENEEKLKLEYERIRNELGVFISENEVLIQNLIHNYPLSSTSFNNNYSYSDYKTKLSNFINLVPHKDYLFKNIFQFPTLKQICNIYDNFDIDIRSLNNQFVKNGYTNLAGS